MKRLLSLIVVFEFVHGLNILMFVPTLSYSHVAFNAAIARKMAHSGHRVLMVQMLIDHNVFVNHSSFEVVRKYVGIDSGHARKILWENPDAFEDASPMNWRIVLKLFRTSDMFVSACRELMRDKEFIQDLKSKRFDIGMLEQYDSCGFGLFKKIGIPHSIWLSATGLFRNQPSAFGVPRPISYVPELFIPTVDGMSFPTRVLNFGTSIVTESLLSLTVWRQSLLHNIDVLNWMERSSVLANVGPSLEEPAPLSSSFSNIVGITLEEEDSISSWNHLLDVAETASEGFILVSFGSIARTIDMTHDMKNSLIGAMSRLYHLTFIVKWEENCTILMPPNVFTSQWLPQKQLIKHRNFLAMFTHGGWSSMLEVLDVGRPLVLLPLFADHWHNARIAMKIGATVVLDKSSITENDIVSVIREITTQNRFSNARRLSSILHNYQPTDVTSLLDFRLRTARHHAENPAFRMRRRHDHFNIELLLLLIPLVLILSR